MTHGAFLFDTNLCTGCAACAIACQIENQPQQLSGDVPTADWLQWRHLHVFNPQRQPGLTSYALSLACNHCRQPACMHACPAAAYSKDPHTGAVTIDPGKCIGCRYCTWACPYGAPQYDRRARLMTKCTFCNHRLQSGGQPACTAACPTGALAFGSLAGASPGLGTAMVGFPTTRLEPAIRFRPLQAGSGAGPLTEWTPPPPGRAAAGGIRLAHEWPLWLLTSVMPLAFAWFGAGAAALSGPFGDLAVLALGGLALLASTLHLGQPLRAWRAVLNLRTSWLSREILSVGAFLGLAAAATLAGFLLGGSELRPYQLGLLVVGAAMLYAIDRVYDVTRLRYAPPQTPYQARPHQHSALSLPGGLHLLGVVAGWLLLNGQGGALHVALLTLGAAAGLLQALSYLNRHRRYPPPGLARWRPPLRLLLILLPWLLLGLNLAPALALPLAALGQALDRAEYYEDLVVTAPGFGN